MALIDLFICIYSLLETLEQLCFLLDTDFVTLPFFLIGIFIMPERVAASSCLLNSDFDKSLFPWAAG